MFPRLSSRRSNTARSDSAKTKPWTNSAPNKSKCVERREAWRRNISPKVFHSEFTPLEWSIAQHREDVKSSSYSKLIVDKSNVRERKKDTLALTFLLESCDRISCSLSQCRWDHSRLRGGDATRSDERRFRSNHRNSSDLFRSKAFLPRPMDRVTHRFSLNRIWRRWPWRNRRVHRLNKKVAEVKVPLTTRRSGLSPLSREEDQELLFKLKNSSAKARQRREASNSDCHSSSSFSNKSVGKRSISSWRWEKCARDWICSFVDVSTSRFLSFVRFSRQLSCSSQSRRSSRSEAERMFGAVGTRHGRVGSMLELSMRWIRRSVENSSIDARRRTVCLSLFEIGFYEFRSIPHLRSISTHSTTFLRRRILHRRRRSFDDGRHESEELLSDEWKCFSHQRTSQSTRTNEGEH